MYESIQPFLKTLKNLDPARFPLRKYLVHTGLESVEIGPPAYARNFEWDLLCGARSTHPSLLPLQAHAR
jgi:hypothetical protein